eukprot:gb/GECG01007137.1/.p1 GENE.gb/GECG01007137.1/~~gb/GECG01007137.1/.p1  ORF type:complete len:152 (+),score=11.15 gb/GECG01007137.1/:1-456(+)
MTTSLKKTRKKRSHVSHGHGRVGKHRCHPGGRGNAGGQHHHRTLFDRFHPGHFGKVGMRYFHKEKNLHHCPTLNLDKLWSLVSEETLEKAKSEAQKKSGNAPLIDVTDHGYFKVLGNGRLPKIPVVVRARHISRLAEKKIKGVGGAVVLTA